jgi:ABC-type transport system involved in cytochrome c biogenesis permease subunit
MSMALERTTLVAAVSGLALVLLLDALARGKARSSWPAVSAGLSIVLALLTAAVAGRWLRESQGPFLTLYDVLLSNLFSLTLVYLVAAWLVPALRTSSAIVVGFLGVLGVWSLTVSAEAVPLPATFDNPWLWLHVTAGKLFLGLCLPAAATAMWLLAKPESATRGSGEMDAAVWLTLSLAFVCHSFMLIAGAIWAHSAWGRYWAWD